MTHLTDDSLLRLAKTIADDLPFSADERKDMEHVRTCNDCCDYLVALAALLRAESAEGMAEAGLSLRRLTMPKPMQTVFHFSLKKVGESLLSSLQQSADSFAAWHFEPPLAAAARSAREGDTTHRLEAPESERTFIQIDTKENRLVIQIDKENLPYQFVEACLRMPDGKSKPLEFTEHGSILHTVISPLPGDAFDIILKTQK